MLTFTSSGDRIEPLHSGYGPEILTLHCVKISPLRGPSRCDQFILYQ